MGSLGCRGHETLEPPLLQASAHEHVELDSHDAFLHVRLMSLSHHCSHAAVRRVLVLQERQLQTREEANETLFSKSNAKRRFQQKAV